MVLKVEPNTKLINAIMLLRHHSQQGYDDLVVALNELAQRRANDMVVAPPEHLRFMQGRANEAKDLAELVGGIVTHYKKLQDLNKRG